MLPGLAGSGHAGPVLVIWLVVPGFFFSFSQSKLPGYMLPFRWMAFDALPTNANGKVDRRWLKETFQASRERETQAYR